MDGLDMHQGRHCIGRSDQPIKFPPGAEHGKHSVTNAILPSFTNRRIHDGEDMIGGWNPYSATSEYHVPLFQNPLLT